MFLLYRFKIDFRFNLQLEITLFFGLLYHFFGIELEILRDYININLISGFIRRINSSAGVFIFFIKKNGFLRFYIDYRGINAIIIKNRYSFF